MGLQVSSGFWIPKYRKKILYGNLRKQMGDIFRELASHRESQIHEGHLMGDYIHMLISIPPKYSVSQVVGYIKVKSTIPIARTYMGKRRDFKRKVFGPGVTMRPQQSGDLR